VDCAVDLVGIPTDGATVDNERWLGIFLRFKRQLSDPRTAGNSQQMFFRRDESFELVVRQAPELVELRRGVALVCWQAAFGQPPRCLAFVGCAHACRADASVQSSRLKSSSDARPRMNDSKFEATNVTL
jgi:hypothetical protein